MIDPVGTIHDSCVLGREDEKRRFFFTPQTPGVASPSLKATKKGPRPDRAVMADAAPQPQGGAASDNYNFFDLGDDADDGGNEPTNGAPSATTPRATKTGTLRQSLTLLSE